MKALIMAGGTGGHVYPALAVAEVLRTRGVEVVWMGAPDSFESRAVAKQGFPIEYVRIKGLRGKGARSWLGAPPLLARAVGEAAMILRRQRPNVVLGMGGFASGPGGAAARLAKLPLVIHEQNAAAGLTNRLLARFATVVLEAFPRCFHGARTVGNPVRAGFSELKPPHERLKTRRLSKPRLLVLGGSQGARCLNEMVPVALARLPAARRPRVRHQGGRTEAIAQKAYSDNGVAAEVSAFIDDMPDAYGWADLVVSRAGASTIAELAAAGCPALLVPYPHAVDDHQARNGEYLVKAGAARMILEKDLSPEILADQLAELLSDRGRLIAMAESARAAAWPDSAARIADACMEAAL